MPYADNEGVRIHYEAEGQGPSLVLAHGLAGSTEMWRSLGVVDALKNEYHLILVDARGHGGSDKPHDPAAYTQEKLAGDFVAVLNRLHVPQTHYLGGSLGARLGFALARFAQPRLRSLILGGNSPFRGERERQFYLGLREQVGAILSSGNGFAPLVARYERVWGPLSAPFKAALLSNDGEAILSLMAAVREWPGDEDILPGITVPCLLYAGEADPNWQGVQEAARRIPRATFLSVPGDHTVGTSNMDLVLPALRSFLAGLQGPC